MRVINGQTYKYVPSYFDKFLGGNTKDVPSGTLVKVVQPSGCPKNGTMGMCYVDDVTTGEFIGLVCVGSLERNK